MTYDPSRRRVFFVGRPELSPSFRKDRYEHHFECIYVVQDDEDMICYQGKLIEFLEARQFRPNRDLICLFGSFPLATQACAALCAHYGSFGSLVWRPEKNSKPSIIPMGKRALQKYSEGKCLPPSTPKKG